MWQEPYIEDIECPCCHDTVEEKDYNWLVSMCKECINGHTVEQEQSNIDKLKEKANKFDELQKSWWWLQRRTHEGKTPTSVIRYFLSDIEKHFEPYKEEDNNE